jgi:phosphatidylglycerol---prolipoprotein diacylglyceryl transferase
MRRVLFSWRGTPIHSYPAMLYVGAVVGIIVGALAAGHHGLSSGRVWAAMLLLMLPSMIGARLMFVVAHWRDFVRRPGAILRGSEGGAGLYGGLVIAALLSLPVLRMLELPVGGFWDAAIVTMLIGMAFTKIGCLLNGCCAGRPAEGHFTLCLPNVHGVWRRRRPAQLVEAALAGVLVLAAFAVWERAPFDGAVFLAMVAAYALARFGLEPARESIDSMGTLSVHRTISLALVAGCLLGLLLLWPR